MNDSSPQTNTDSETTDVPVQRRLADPPASPPPPPNLSAEPRSGTQVDADPVPSRTGRIPERLGDYRIVRKIGSGGMGSVYLAEDLRLCRNAAIKTMKPELAADTEHRSRFEREARAAAAVEHDNIVPIWGIGEAADGTPYIAMPFLQGEMLESRLVREPVSPAWLIVAVGCDTASGLAAAHARGLIHRDIKPGNIWLEGDPAELNPVKKVRRVKVLDFGLARSITTEETQLTATGLVMGTPAYMAPEQARGMDIDGRADVWSLGAVLYRMATGRQPFQGSTTMAILCALIADTPQPVRAVNPAVPPALAALIDQMLQKDPSTRPTSAGEVAEQLRRIASSTDLFAITSAPVFASDTSTGSWAGTDDETEPGEMKSLLIAEPLAEEIEANTDRNRQPPTARQGPPPAPAAQPPAQPVLRPGPKAQPPAVQVPPPAPSAAHPTAPLPVPPPAPAAPPAAPKAPVPAPRVERLTAYVPPRPPSKVPLPLALAVLVLIGAIGVLVFRTELFGEKADPSKDSTPVKFQKPDESKGVKFQKPNQ
jgi:serine/threonine protein kinase